MTDFCIFAFEGFCTNIDKHFLKRYILGHHVNTNKNKQDETNDINKTILSLWVK